MQRLSSFWREIAWSGIGALFQHCALMIHETALLTIAPSALNAQAAITFSCIYLASSLAHSGFAAGIAPILAKQGFSRTVLTRLIIPHLGITALCASGIATIWHTCCTFSAGYESIAYTLTIALLAAAEGIREDLKACLQLTQQSKRHAHTTCLFIAGYIAHIWILYAGGMDLNLMLLLIPLGLCSVVSSLYLLICLARTISNTHPIEPLHFRTTTTHRLSATTYTLSKLPFSSNVLIPIVAPALTAPAIATLKWASNALHHGAAIIRRATLLPLVARFVQDDHQSPQNLGSWIHCASIVLIALAIALLVIGHQGGTHTQLAMLGMMFTLIVTDQLCLAQEARATARNHTNHLARIGLTAALCAALTLGFSTLNPGTTACHLILMGVTLLGIARFCGVLRVTIPPQKAA